MPAGASPEKVVSAIPVGLRGCSVPPAAGTAGDGAGAVLVAAERLWLADPAARAGLMPAGWQALLSAGATTAGAAGAAGLGAAVDAAAGAGVAAGDAVDGVVAEGVVGAAAVVEAAAASAALDVVTAVA